MPDYDDRRDDDRYDDADPGRDDELIRRAKAKVSGPATFLIIAAAVMFLGLAANVALVASGYDIQVAILQWFEGMAQGPEKEKLRQQIEQAKTRDKTPEMIQNVAGVALGLVFDVLVLLGGLRMRALKSYGLAMAGTICALIPCNSCCLIGLPAGIWGIIALTNADVKAAFAANARRGTRDLD